MNRIDGGCHCGNIRYSLAWPADPASITTRLCDCTFCSKHGGNWASHRDAALSAEIHDPFVTCSVGGLEYAVINANTFEGIDVAALPRTAATFEGESTSTRLERRTRNWIRNVRISTTTGG